MRNGNDFWFWRAHPEAKAPVRMTEGSVGYDICACEGYALGVGAFSIINTGLVVEPPPGYHIEIYLRSSLPKKKGLLIPNGAGIIDRDYCGENDVLGVPVYKFGRGTKDIYSKEAEQEVCSILPGERIAQLIIRKTNLNPFTDYTDAFISPLDRDRGGFGSTGNK